MSFKFSFTHGKTIAYIKGGQYNSNIIRYYNTLDEKEIEDNESVNNLPVNKTDIIGLNLYRSLGKRVSFAKLNKINDYINTDSIPEYEDLKTKKFYFKCQNEYDKLKDKEIILNDGVLYPTFDITAEREVFYIAGMAGSGKSTYISYLMKSYNILYPDRDIILFSNKTIEPAFDNIKYTRINMNSELYENPLTLGELSNKLIIFDDYEYGTDLRVVKALFATANLILFQGRSSNIHMIYVAHLANNYKETRGILAEMTSITVFPQMTTPYSLKYLFTKYFGFDKEAVNKIFKLPSRWVTIYKSPFIITYSGGAYIMQNS